MAHARRPTYEAIREEYAAIRDDLFAILAAREVLIIAHYRDRGIKAMNQTRGGKGVVGYEYTAEKIANMTVARTAAFAARTPERRAETSTRLSGGLKIRPKCPDAIARGVAARREGKALAAHLTQLHKARVGTHHPGQRQGAWRADRRDDWGGGAGGRRRGVAGSPAWTRSPHAGAARPKPVPRATAPSA